MPATEVTPSMRRRLSDEARQLLRNALNCTVTNHLNNLSLSQRLHNFRGKIRFEIPTVEMTLYLRIVATDSSYLLRYHLETSEIDTEISVLNKAGACTSWMTSSNGQTQQLRTYLNDSMTPDSTKAQLTTLLELMDNLDLFDVFKAAQTATEVEPNGSTLSKRLDHVLLNASTDKMSYVFVVDPASGTPLAVTQTTVSGHRMHLIIEDYVRYDGGIIVPIGIQSDVDLMIETAMNCFAQWSLHGQRLLMNIFDVMDKDGDGYITSQDILDQLISVGQSPTQSTNIVTEMARLLCDSSNPSEEFEFFNFCGFWVTMLADQYHVSDPENESTVLRSFEKLFIGV